MKTISIKAILFGCVFSASSLFAQTEKKEQTVRDLPELNMTEGVNIHFISPEPIQFVDLSTDELIGDLPSENIARIKITNKQEQDSVKVIKQKRNSFYSGEQIGIITIVGQSFMTQYKAVFVLFFRCSWGFSGKRFLNRCGCGRPKAGSDYEIGRASCRERV